MNQSLPAEQEAPSVPSSIKRKPVRALGLTLLLAIAGAIWLLSPSKAPPASITVLASDYAIQAPPLPVPDRWIPRTWGWLWRMRYTVLGQPVTIDIETRRIHFRALGPSRLQQLFEARAPLVSTNGVRGWILPEAELKRLAARLEREESEHRISRMSLGVGILATMSMTSQSPIPGSQRTVGDTITYATSRRGDTIELTGSFLFTAAVTNTQLHKLDSREEISFQTNMALAASMQIPRDHSVFLYDTTRVPTEKGGSAVIIQLKRK